ncbi:unnamed protein product [Brassica oleracea]
MHLSTSTRKKICLMLFWIWMDLFGINKSFEWRFLE